jgi:hypothetical protein
MTPYGFAFELPSLRVLHASNMSSRWPGKAILHVSPKWQTVRSRERGEASICRDPTIENRKCNRERCADGLVGTQREVGQCRTIAGGCQAVNSPSPPVKHCCSNSPGPPLSMRRTMRSKLHAPDTSISRPDALCIMQQVTLYIHDIEQSRAGANRQHCHGVFG